MAGFFSISSIVRFVWNQGVDEDVKSVTNELVRKLQAHEEPTDSRFTFSVVQAHSGAGNKDTPCYVSIGPCHRDSTQLRREAEKLSYLKRLIGVENINHEYLGHLVQNVKNLMAEDPHILDCFGSEPERRRDLLEMLLLDGCYLMYFGALRRDEDQPGQDDALSENFNNGSYRAATLRDTWYLLQNQIPLVVVERIYELITEDVRGPVNQVRQNLMEYGLVLFRSRSYVPDDPTSDQRLKLNNMWEGRSLFAIEPAQTADQRRIPDHLLHLLHSLLEPNEATTPGDTDEAVTWRSATEYVSRCNVKFVQRTLDGHSSFSILDVSIHKDKLQVPRLLIDDNTWTILHNMMVLEQHKPFLGTYVTAYCFFMSQMVCTAEDVKLLSRAGVIRHSHGDPAEVAKCFNSLCKGFVLETNGGERNYLIPIWLNLEERHKKLWHKLLSWFRLNYWSWNFPVLIALFTAAILLVSGVVSAVYAVLAYNRQVDSESAPSPHN